MKEKDKKILLELLKNGRESVSRIGHSIGVTRQTVSRRIKELQQKGIIKGFTAELSAREFGLKERAFIIIKAKPESELRRKVEKRIKDMEEVIQFHYLFGRFDALLEVVTESEGRLHRIIEMIHEFEAVEDTETLIVHKPVKNDPKSPFVGKLKDSGF